MLLLDEASLPPVARYALRQGDRCLVLAQRLCQWVTHAPDLAEEVALANIALDLLGQARALLSYTGELEGAGRDEDALAYGRTDREFRNVLLVERPNGDFATTMARQFLHDAWAIEVWAALTGSHDPRLAALAARAVKETGYHVRHSAGWVVRLGDGTEESAHRAQEALEELWRFTGELFEVDEVEEALSAAGVLPADAHPSRVRERWQQRVDAVLVEATLAPPANRVMATGGRDGIHTEHLGHLLAEMQVLPRTYPAARW